MFNMFNSEFSPEVCDLLKRKRSYSQPSILSNVKLHTRVEGRILHHFLIYETLVKKRDILTIFSTSTGALSSFRHDFNLFLLLLSPRIHRNRVERHTLSFPPKKRQNGTLNAGSTNLFINAEPEGNATKNQRTEPKIRERFYTGILLQTSGQRFYIFQKITP